MPSTYVHKKVWVDNSPLREAYNRLLMMGNQPQEIAEWCGMIRKDGVGDKTILERSLGIKAYKRKGKEYKSKKISEDVAARLVAGMGPATGLDPVDVGL